MGGWLRKAGAWWALGVLYLSPVTAQTWTELLPTIRRRFPEVRQLSTQELADWLGPKPRPGPKPVLIDVRPAAEHGVSHLEGAVRASTVGAVRALGLEESRPLVVYCSVGYRSSELGVRLIRAGFTNVFNLEGSIFAWANEGRPVYRGTNRVAEVHPFDRRWGVLLDRKWHPAEGRVESR
jgi:rhodanese-related sulfurtransferase